jgi:hypothetical protein
MTHQGLPDPNEITHRVVTMVTSDKRAEEPDSRHAEASRKRGNARAVALSAEERSAIATMGTEARWAQPSS